MRQISRRSLLCVAMTLPIAVNTASAKDSPIELSWGDLLPEGDTAAKTFDGIGVVQHGEISTPADNFSRAPVTTKYNGKRVRIPGYVVPLDFSGVGVTEFILVPYVGACIHVPPPPPNQLVYVTTEQPHEIEGLFAPVFVEGLFGTNALETELADIGYALAADKIEPFE